MEKPGQAVDLQGLHKNDNPSTMAVSASFLSPTLLTHLSSFQKSSTENCWLLRKMAGHITNNCDALYMSSPWKIGPEIEVRSGTPRSRDEWEPGRTRVTGVTEPVKKWDSYHSKKIRTEFPSL